MKLRCPVSKFICHTISHFFFLALLALATFGADSDLRPTLNIIHGRHGQQDGEKDWSFGEGRIDDDDDVCHMHDSQASFRHTMFMNNWVEVVIIFWIIG